MTEPTQREYTSEEFRDLLVKLFGQDTDWGVASKAAPYFGVDHRTVYRWLSSGRTIDGPTAIIASMLDDNTALESLMDQVWLYLREAEKVHGDAGQAAKVFHRELRRQRTKHDQAKGLKA